NLISAFLADDESVQPVAPGPVAPPRPVGPSVDLERQAEKVMVMGVLSIVFGWTVLLPLFAVAQYIDTSNAAKKENLPTPSKATTGLVLALLFGSVQVLALIAKFVPK